MSVLGSIESAIVPVQPPVAPAPPKPTQTMVNPSGDVGEVPVEHVAEAQKNGYHPVVKMTNPDGAVGHVRVDQVDEAKKAGYKNVEPAEHEKQGELARYQSADVSVPAAGGAYISYPVDSSKYTLEPGETRSSDKGKESRKAQAQADLQYTKTAATLAPMMVDPELLGMATRPAAAYVAENVLPVIEQTFPWVGKAVEIAEKSPSLIKAMVRGGTSGAGFGALGGTEEAIRTKDPTKILKGAGYGALGGALVGGGAYGIKKLAGTAAAEAAETTAGALGTVEAKPPVVGAKGVLGDVTKERVPVWKTAETTSREAMPPRGLTTPESPTVMKGGPMKTMETEIGKQAGVKPLESNVSLKEQLSKKIAAGAEKPSELAARRPDLTKVERQFAHSNSEEALDAVRGDPKTMNALQKLSNDDVAKAAERLKIDTSKIGGGAKNLRENTIRAILKAGHSGEAIVKNAY